MADLTKIFKILNDQYDMDDLDVICFELGVTFDDIAGDTQKMKAKNVTEYMDNHGRISDLLNKIRETRPALDLSDLMPSPGMTSRLRPSIGGCSISHFQGGAATLGCLVVDRKIPDQVYFLCDTSGLAPAWFHPMPGAPIVQPGVEDGGKAPQDIIATLIRWATLMDDPAHANLNISASLAQIKNLADVSAKIFKRGFLQGVRPAQPGMIVYGVGRSGEQMGQIIQTNASITLQWPASQVFNPSRTPDQYGQVPVTFSELIATTDMVQSGDSGMVLLDEDNYALGLGFAGGNGKSYFIPMQKVLDVLEVNLVTETLWRLLVD